MAAHVEADIVLASFTTQARGIRLYDVDCRRLVPGTAVVVRRES